MLGYDQKSDSFLENWTFDKNYVDSMKQLLIKYTPSDLGHFCDLGCGVGHFSQAIADYAQPGNVTLVDLSVSMLEQASKRMPGANCIHSDLEQFALHSNEQLDFVLLKECVHHIANVNQFLNDLAQNGLKKGAQILVLTRPQKVNFPFCAKGLQDFEKSQPALSKLLDAVPTDKFSTEVFEESIRVELTKTKLLSMIQNRFMSIYDTWSDADLHDSVETLQASLPELNVFDDKFYFVKLSLS